jgi:putative membrane protein
MDNTQLPSPEWAEEGDKKAKKKEKREFKDQLAMERTSLALDRTILAMVRTGTTFMTFGFALYKLMKEQAAKPGDHPIMHVLSPRIVALVLFVSGFVGLAMQLYNVVLIRKRIQMYQPNFWKSPVVLLSYVILLMLFLLILAVTLGNA